MNYREFINSGFYKTLINKCDAKADDFNFPLMFAEQDVFIAEISYFGWIDDYLYDKNSMMVKILRAKDATMKVLAVVDLGSEVVNINEVEVNANEEAFFLVDTANEANPVYIWEHDAGKPKKLHTTFDDFISCLKNFK